MKQLRAEIDRAIGGYASDDPDIAIEDVPEPRPRPKPLHIDGGFASEDACDIPGPAEPLEVPPGLPLPPPAPPKEDSDEEDPKKKLPFGEEDEGDDADDF